MMSFAWNLKTMRSQSGLTQEELATAIGVSQKTVSSWEKGRTDPSIEETIKICKALNCPMEALTGVVMRSVGEISFDDILVKIRNLDTVHLVELYKTIEEIIAQKQRLKAMEKEREEQLKQLKEYEAKIAELKQRIAEGSKQ